MRLGKFLVFLLITGTVFSLKCMNIDKFDPSNISCEAFFYEVDQAIQFMSAKPIKPYGQAKIFNESDLIVCMSDVHGDIDALMSNIKYMQELGLINVDCRLRKGVSFFMLGDLIDRGGNSLAVLYFSLILKKINPEQFFILKGNHETEFIYNYSGTLKNELEVKFGQKKVNHSQIIKLFERFPDVFFAGERTQSRAVNYLQLNHAGPGTYFKKGYGIYYIGMSPLLECASDLSRDEAGSIYTYEFWANVEQNNGFLWNDIDGLKGVLDNSMRYSNTLKFSERAARGYLESMSRPGQFYVSGLIGGHQHLEGGGVELSNGTWIPMANKETKIIGDKIAYKITSNKSEYKSNGFFVIKFDKKAERWAITPYIEGIEKIIQERFNFDEIVDGEMVESESV